METLENISLICCSLMCAFGAFGLLLLSSLARRAGSSLWGVVSSGGLLGLMNLTNMGDVLEIFLGSGAGRGDDDGDDADYRGRRR
jgi:hypothetical protein